MKLYVKASDVKGEMVSLNPLDLKVELPEDIILTWNGAADLENKGISGYFTWVGYKHKGRGQSRKTMLRRVEDSVYDLILPAFAKYCNVDEDDINVDDFSNSVDMYRVWVEVKHQ